MGRASGSESETSRSGITRLPASRWSVCESSRPVAQIVSVSSPTSRPSRPSPGRRASARRALPATTCTSRGVVRAIRATSPVSWSTSAIATPVRRRRVRASYLPRINGGWGGLDRLTCGALPTDPRRSGGVNGEGVQVVGQDRPAGPDPLALVAPQAATPQPIATFEVADAALAAGAVAGQPPAGAPRARLGPPGDERARRCQPSQGLGGRAGQEPTVQRHLPWSKPQAVQLPNGLGK